MLSKFNVRVYGLPIISNQILICDEVRGGFSMTKFVGGGLEFGESTIECLEREFNEELGAQIVNIKHFYTTDFFVESAFNPSQQILSIYYLLEIPATTALDRHTDDNGDTIDFRWVDLKTLSDVEMTFPIDRKVCSLLVKESF